MVKSDKNAKKFGGWRYLRRIYGHQKSAANAARRNFSGSYGIRLKIRLNTTNSANKTDKLRQSNPKYKQHNKGV